MAESHQRPAQERKGGDGGEKGGRQIGIEFPPVKSREEILNSQRAAVTQEEIRKGMQDDIPPVVRSVLELAHLMMSGHSQKLRASPGYQGGLFYGGSPFCFASGYRDGTRPRDMEDKGNHMKLKDPLTYGVLSLPVTAGYLCELHGKGVFDLQAPLARYLPELEEKLDPCVTARSILAFDTVVDDNQVMRDAGVRRFRPLFAWNVCAATQRCVYAPITHFFAGGSAKALTGQQQRENYVQYLRASPRVRVRLRPRRWISRRGVSHFSVALLIAAVERQLHGVSFEDSIRQTVFEPAQSHGAGYGPPKLWRDPNEMFYQPRGLARQHQRFSHPLPTGALENCGPPLLNASLNLYAPVEDYGKLLLLSLDAVRHARTALGGAGPPPKAGAHFDFGVEWLNGDQEPRQRLQLTRRVVGIDYTPTAASFRYNCEHDLGCFGVANCGSRDACVLANALSRMLQHLFVKHVIRKGVDVARGPDLDNPEQERSGTEAKFRKIIKKQEYTSYFRKHDAHKRY
ncbi:uncharacterized protein Tco025E_06385 [Trypanosoma conorhini]|uniref:Beta-lactamase-related domain-containing protein n=1 Tax=Trypanosoma conorhini TaxID=83891 RepID=A0A422P5H3_9TRYP|nr:uncharacterized protein Tco025E_06385 [Trypanosoma conorhini]RNF12969.1 hypothetical protein Tco025E_06385 [Trypanosoma conorhini]